MGLSATVVNRWKSLTPSLLNAVSLQVEALQLTNQGIRVHVPLAYNLTIGHLLLAESSQDERAFLHIETVSPVAPLPPQTPDPSPLVVVEATWATKQTVTDAKHLYWVASNAVLTALSPSIQQEGDAIALSDVFCPNLTLHQDYLLSNTLLQSADKLVLTETLVTLLMQLRGLGKLPIVLDLLGVFKQLALPNVSVVQLGEAGGVFYSVEAYGVESLISDCIAQLPEPLQAGAWNQYAHAFANVTQPIEALQTLNQYLEQSGAGLLYRQLHRMEQTSLFAKQPQASYFSIAQLVNQAPHAALWVVDLSTLPTAVLPWLVKTIAQEIAKLSLGKDQLALAVLNADYQTSMNQLLNPTNKTLYQANLPFIQGQWRKQGTATQLAVTDDQQILGFNLSVELLAPEGLVLLQGKEATNNLLLVLGLPPIHSLSTSHSPAAPSVITPSVALPALQETLVAPPSNTEAEDDDSWIHIAAQGSTVIHLIDKHSQNRFNTGATAREFLLQESTTYGEASALFSPLPASVEELPSQGEAKHNRTSHDTLDEEALPPLDTLNLPEGKRPDVNSDSEEEETQLPAGVDGEYYNSILGQMPAHWRKILERELRKEAPLPSAKSSTLHPEAYPDAVVADPHPPALQLGEIALTEEIVANTHALHPCLPDDMMADIESFYTTTEAQFETTGFNVTGKPATAIPTSHLSEFLDAQLLDGIDEPLPEIEAISPDEAAWFRESAQRAVMENVIPFVEIEDFVAVAPPVANRLTEEIAVMETPEPIASTAPDSVFSQVFEHLPTVTMDAQLLHEAQAPLVANHPQGQWAVKPVESLPEVPLSPLAPPTEALAELVVEQHPLHPLPEAGLLDFSVQPDLFVADAPHHGDSNHADFPMFNFDLTELPDFGEKHPTEAPPQTVIPATVLEAEPFLRVDSPPSVASIVQQLPKIEAVVVEEQPSPSSVAATADWQTLSTQLDTLTDATPYSKATTSVNSSVTAVETAVDPSLVNDSPAVGSGEIVGKITVGMRVRHDEYGTGTVQAVVPLEERSVVSILFDTHGSRLLDPSLSTLYPA